MTDIKFRVLMPNGEPVEGRTTEWLAAILLELPEASRQRVCERIRKKMVAYSTPGSYILQAEGLKDLIKVG